jgi:outer membrane protein
MPLKISLRGAVAGALALVFALALTAPLAAQEMKIAILDTEQILLQSETGKKALERLKTLRTEKEEEGKRLQSELEALQQRLSEGRLSLAEDRIRELEKELEDKAIAMRRFQDDANRELNKRRDDILAEVDGKVMPIINQFGQEQGFDLIFRKFESGLIYADAGIDITAEVIERLDAGQAGDGAASGN